MNFFNFYAEPASDYSVMFNLNHLYMFLTIIISLGLLLFFLKRLPKKGQNVVLIICSVMLIVLEISRIVYRALKHYDINGSMAGFDWYWSISFQMCAMMVWFVSINTLISLKNPNSKWSQFSFNIMYGVALLGGILTFLYPDLVHTDYPFFHFMNVQTILSHMLLIFVPLYIVVTKRLNIKYKNIYKAFIGLLGAAAIAMTFSLISGDNFMYMKEFSLLSDFGVEIPFPYHLLILAPLAFILMSILYLVGNLICHLKKKNAKNS
jgi:uncharacterized membrane protein YwaF